MRPPLNWTTQIPVLTTLGEIHALLVEGGARSISVLYDQQQPVGLTFAIPTAHGELEYRLPVTVAAVLKMLERASEEYVKSGTGWQARERRRVPLSKVTTEQAARVGWRVVKDWLEAQLALIAIGLVTLDEVMLPYQLVGPDQTLYQLAVAKGLLALPMAKGRP